MFQELQQHQLLLVRFFDILLQSKITKGEYVITYGKVGRLVVGICISVNFGTGIGVAVGVRSGRRLSELLFLLFYSTSSTFLLLLRHNLF